jgi:hypothetical protein
VSRKLGSAVRKWLESERSGREEEAEKALFKVFARLPEVSLPNGFAARVMASAGLTPVRQPARLTAPAWALRGFVLVCLLLAGMAALALPTLLPPLAGLFHVGLVLEVGVEALVGLLQRLGDGLTYWRAMTQVSEVFSSLVTTPPLFAALVAGILLSIGAFRLLYGLMIPERSIRYVGSV